MILKNTVPVEGAVVCAVGRNYVICVPVNKEVLVQAEVDGKTYYCESNGVRKSGTRVQKFVVPAEALDRTKRYKITYEVLNKRLAYSSERQPSVSVEYSFRPIEKDTNINIYHLSDVHGMGKAAVKTGSFFAGELDMLLLNGDISSSSESEDDILLNYRIAYEITKGEIPCVITRGNHDLRGRYAEKLDELMPTAGGKPYFTVKVGPVWMLVLDCGEDKDDSHGEYGGTVVFHNFREQESEFLNNVIASQLNEYGAADVKYRFVLCHIPFCHSDNGECKGERPFNIENEIYTDWCAKIKENIKPDLSVFGHVHETEIFPDGSSFDDRGLGGEMILGGAPVSRTGLPDMVVGTALSIEENGIRIRFTDSRGKVSEDKKLIKIF